MSWGEIRDLLTIPSLVLSLAAVLYTWLTATSKKNSEDIAEIRSVQETQGRQIQEIETSIKHLPDKDTVHKLELQLKDMQSEMAAFRAEQKAASNTLRRLEDYLLRQSGNS